MFDVPKLKKKNEYDGINLAPGSRFVNATGTFWLRVTLAAEI